MSAATQEALNDRRREIAGMVHACVPVRTICDQLDLPCHYLTLRTFIKKTLGLKPHAGQRHYAERKQRALDFKALRDQGKSYAKIGRQYDLSHERIRQELQEFHPDALGLHYKCSLRWCAHCHDPFWARKNDHRIVCNQRCWSALVRLILTRVRQKQLVQLILQCRRDGLTWKQTAEIATPKRTSHENLPGWTAKLAKKWSIDISDAYGYSQGGKRLRVGRAA